MLSDTCVPDRLSLVCRWLLALTGSGSPPASTSAASYAKSLVLLHVSICGRQVKV